MGKASLDQIEVFLKVCEVGNFSAAGRALGRAQSAVSYSVGQLEGDLGVSLFSREGRIPVLSEEAKALLPDFRALVFQANNLLRRAMGLSKGVEAKVDVVVDSLLPGQCIYPLLHSFKQNFPETRLLLRDETMGAALKPLLNGNCDLGFLAGMGEPARLPAEKVGTMQMTMVVGKDHCLARHTEPVRESELAEHTQIVVSDRSADKEGEDRGVLSPTTWRVADFRTKLSLIAAGFGFGNVPYHLCRTALATGEVCILRGENSSSGTFDMPVHALFASRRPVGPATRWLADAIKRALLKQPLSDSTNGEQTRLK